MEVQEQKAAEVEVKPKKVRAKRAKRIDGHETGCPALQAWDITDACNCDYRAPKAPKKPKVEKVAHPCFGASRIEVTVPTSHYGLRMDFTPSNAQLLRYCEHFGYKPKMQWDEEAGYSRPTFKKEGLLHLLTKYPADQLFPLISLYRQVEKCKGTYVDGLTIREDGRVGGEFLHTPSTGRLSMRNPNHQNQPRGDEEDSPYYQVRSMYIAGPGQRLVARDFAGIEARIVAYLAGVNMHTGEAIPGRDDAQQMLRLTAIDIHGHLASNAIGQPADLTWSDADLGAYFEELKKENREWEVYGAKYPYKTIRNTIKPAVYGSLYGGKPSTLVANSPKFFPDETVAAYYQGLLFNHFPSILRWHQDVFDEVDRHWLIRSADGYRQHYPDIYQRVWSKEDQVWKRNLIQRVADQAVNAVPQHLGMCFTGQGIDLFWENYEELRHGLRLTIHDEILGEWPEHEVLAASEALRVSMETPLDFLPLPASWGLGSHLQVGTEAKCSPVGGSWKSMSSANLPSA